MSDLSDGAVRAAETLLRTCGGMAVQLRMAQGATAGNDGEQLGLATPAFNDVELAPCVWRRLSGEGGVLLVSGAAVLELVGTLEFGSAELLFGAAAGVVVDGELLRVLVVEAMCAAGSVMAWRLTLTR